MKQHNPPQTQEPYKRNTKKKIFYKTENKSMFSKFVECEQLILGRYWQLNPDTRKKNLNSIT